MLLGLFILSNDGVDYSLQNILFRDHAVHVFYKLVCFLRLIILKVVNDKVQSCLRDHINERREDLLSVLSTTEDH